MKTSMFAAVDLKLETSKEVFIYPKGSLIQVEVGAQDDVYVVHHRLLKEQDYERKAGDACARKGKAGTLRTNQEGKLVCVLPGDESMEYPDYEMLPRYKVKTTNLKFLRMEDLKFFVASTIMETQLSKDIDLLDIQLSDALLQERLTPAHISRYLSETSVLERRYVKEDVEHLRLPVYVRENTITPNDKIKMLATFDKIDAAIEAEIKADDILSLSARTKGNVNETGYLLATDALNGGMNSKLIGYIRNKITESVPKDWKVRKVENAIRINTNNSRSAPLFNLLATLPVKVKVEQQVEGEDRFLEVTLPAVSLDKVVESYYTKAVYYDKYELVEADGDGEGKAPKEGDSCTSDGKKGTLTKQGENLVCMVKETVELSFEEQIFEGDPCQSDDGQHGVIKMMDDCLACVIAGSQVNEESGEAEPVETVVFTIPPVEPTDEASFNNGNTGDSAMPAAGDSCEVHGKQGKLVLINGALICALPSGEKPLGSDGAN